MSLKAAIKVFETNIRFSSKIQHTNKKIKIFFSLILRQLLASKLSTILPFNTRIILRNLYFKLSKFESYIVKNGLKYYIADAESIIILSNKFEKCVWNHIKLLPGDVFIDIGAHIGKYTLPTAKIVGDSGRVVAIEADPRNFSILKKNVEINKLSNVILINKAAYYKDNNKIKFYFGESSGTGSVKKSKGLGYIYIETVKVDSVVSKYSLKPKYIKIDVEGAEYEVLLGCRETLKKYHPKIIIEVQKDNIHRVTKLLKSLNYKYKILFEGDTYIQYLFY